MALQQILTEIHPTNEYDITVKDLTVLETTTLVGTTVASSITTEDLKIEPKDSKNINWDVSGPASVTLNGTSTFLKITFITTALTVGLVSSKLTVNNSSVTATSQVWTDMTDYSGLPATYDGITPVAVPMPIISGTRVGAFDLQIISNGYASMNINDVITINVVIT
jgi:hypothetical protein